MPLKTAIMTTCSGCVSTAIVLPFAQFIYSKVHIFSLAYYTLYFHCGLYIQEEAELVSMVSSRSVETASDVCDDDDVFVDALR